MFTSCAVEEESNVETLSSELSSALSSNSIELNVNSYSASIENRPIANAFDGNLATRWNGKGRSSTVTIDMGTLVNIDYLKISYYKGNERKSYFDYAYSVDGSSWEDAGSKTSSGSTTGLEIFDLVNGNEVRYIKLTCTGTEVSQWNTINEIEVYGSTIAGNNTGSSVNLALGKAVDQKTTGHGGDPERAVDGNTDGRWSSGSVTHTWSQWRPWWEVNLGAEYSLGDVVIWNRTDSCCSSRLSSFQVLAYDASGEVRVFNKTINEMPNPSLTVNLGGVNAQFVRIKLTGSGTLSLAEVQVFADGADSSSGSTETTTPTSQGGDIMDFLTKDWKITMPFDEDGNDSGNVSNPDDRNNDAVEYQYDELQQASDDYPNYFYVSNNEVFFVAHCGGATTEGSIYPRCELRGVNPSNGDDGLMSFSNGHSLDVTVRAVQTPVEKPEVCMVQLKGSSSNEIIRVDFMDDTSNGIHITQNEDTTVYDVIDYDLGDRLRVRININGTSVRLRMNNLENGDSFDDTWDHDDDEGYFKVGAYTQSSITFCEEKNKSESECTDDNRNAKGVVAVSNLTVNANW